MLSAVLALLWLQEPAAAVQARLQAVLEAWHDGASFPGATAGFASAADGSFALGVGIADREAGSAMRPQDRMLAGSVGKTFVAAVALQQVAEGKLDLDAKVAAYLGKEEWFHRLPNAADMTVRQLMRHQSGLVRYEFNDRFVADLKKDPYRVWKPEEQLAYLFDTEAPFAAGQGWDYSDTNYIVLGLILERLGGAPLNEQIRKRVLEPLELRDTLPSDRPELPGLVQGYAGPANPFGDCDAVLHEGRMFFNPQFEWAGGGYCTTSQDLARWAVASYEGRAYDPKLLPQVLDGVDAPMLGQGVRYGLCAILRQGPHGPVYGHSGFFPGYLTEMAYFPEHKRAIALQVNTSAGRALGRPLGRVIDELMGAWLTSP